MYKMNFIHSYFKNVRVWYPTAHFKHCYVRICILEGPEDDSVRIETCCPNTIINIRNKVLLCLTDTSLYIYTCVKQFGMANIKSFEKYWNIKFHKYPSIGRLIFPCGQT